MKPEVEYLLKCYINEEEQKPQSSQSWLGALFAPFRSSHLRASHVCEPVVLGRHDLSAGPSVPEVDLDDQQREHIRALGGRLRIMAADIDFDHQRARQAIDRAALQNEGLDEDEMEVVNNIHSLRDQFNVSRVADYLKKKLTSRTLRVAFQFLCYSVSTVPEELAVICDLVKVLALYPRYYRRARDDSMYDVIEEFVQERLDA